MNTTPAAPDELATIPGLAADIVCAFVSMNHVSPAEVPALMQSVYFALQNLGKEGVGHVTKSKNLVPFVLIRNSVTQDYIVCLEDGRRFRSIKRHLRTHHGLTPEQYRSKWDLPDSYPTVAPRLATKRSALAKAGGLGMRGTPRTKPA